VQRDGQFTRSALRTPVEPLYCDSNATTGHAQYTEPLEGIKHICYCRFDVTSAVIDQRTQAESSHPQQHNNMAEVIRDEDVRRRVRLAQEFLDPGMLDAVSGGPRLTNPRRRCCKAKLPSRHFGHVEPRTAATHSASSSCAHEQYARAHTDPRRSAWMRSDRTTASWPTAS
jgi:hypothetical protein